MPIYICTGKRFIFKCDLIQKCTATEEEPPLFCIFDHLPIKWVPIDQQTSSKP